MTTSTLAVEVHDGAPSRRSSIFAKFTSTLASPVRHLVSKKKRRYIRDGFDLDLSYITPRLIAMGYPSTSFEATYRNPSGEVKAFLAHYHPGRCKVYNLCIERSYPASLIGLPDKLLEVHPGYDHNALPMFSVLPFCRSLSQWLAADPRHVAAVHCKAGKGRTGMLLCCYMVWSGECATADEALARFGDARTHNGKGVTIPSQQRYVHYTQQLVASAAADEGSGADAADNASAQATTVPLALRLPPMRHIERVQLLNAPASACLPSVYFTVDVAHMHEGEREQSAVKGPSATTSPRWTQLRVYDHRHPGDADAASANGSTKGMGPAPGHQPAVAGDVKIVVRLPKVKRPLAACWFHTGFVEGDTLTIGKAQLDKARKDKKLPSDFALRIVFAPRAAESAAAEATARQSLDALARASATMPPPAVEDEGEEEEEEEDAADSSRVAGSAAEIS